LRRVREGIQVGRLAAHPSREAQALDIHDLLANHGRRPYTMKPSDIITPSQRQAIALIVNAVTETIAECGDMGAPGGTIYAALMHYGCTLQQFESLMAALVRLGKVTKRGELYFAPQAAAAAGSTA